MVGRYFFVQGIEKMKIALFFANSSSNLELIKMKGSANYNPTCS